MKTDESLRSDPLKPNCEAKTAQKRFGIAVVSACVAVSALLAVDGASADDGALPPVQRFGAVSYRNGGFGTEESKAMKAEAATYPLTLTFADRIDNRDAYASNVQVTIVNSDGTSMLNDGSAGPLLLVDLPVGTYKVTATSGTRSKTQAVHIAAGAHKQLVFEWAQAESE